MQTDQSLRRGAIRFNMVRVSSGFRRPRRLIMNHDRTSCNEKLTVLLFTIHLSTLLVSATSTTQQLNNNAGKICTLGPKTSSR